MFSFHFLFTFFIYYYLFFAFEDSKTFLQNSLFFWEWAYCCQKPFYESNERKVKENSFMMRRLFCFHSTVPFTSVFSLLHCKKGKKNYELNMVYEILYNTSKNIVTKFSCLLKWNKLAKQTIRKTRNTFENPISRISIYIVEKLS